MPRHPQKVLPYLLLGAMCALPARAAAEDHGSSAEREEVELLPDPEEHPPTLAGQVHLDMVLPLARDPLCPEDAACVFGGGGGIGGTIERRWPTGYALQLGYDVWMLNSNGVYEITVVQMLRAGVQYIFLRDTLVHPYLAGSIGALALGDSFRVGTVGAAAQANLGVEIELTEIFALTVSTAWRVFFTSDFVTPNDGVERGSGRGVNAALALQLGLAILESP